MKIELIDILYCTYPVHSRGTAEPEMNCGELAVAHAWWNKDKSDGFLLCEEHVNVIVEAEEKYPTPDPLTRPDVTWEELGRGYTANEPDQTGLEADA